SAGGKPFALALTQMKRHSSELEEMDVEGMPAFAERVLPSASNLWVQSSFTQKQRLQHVFFPDGIRFDGKKLVGTGTTLPVFNYLNPISEQKKNWAANRGSERAMKEVHLRASTSAAAPLRWTS